jgi:Leucine-rich repeat (LRR) protein
MSRNTFVALVVSLALAAPLAAAVPASERDALLAFFAATGGPQWTEKAGWGGAAGTECTWYGVQCTNEEDHIYSIELYQNNLTSLGIETLAPLTALDTLNLANNDVPGPLSPSISNLKALRNLQLDSNKLTGSIPQSITQLTQLEALAVGSNQLSGNLPTGMAALTKLQILEGYNNALTGPLPTELASLKALLEINYKGN